MAMLTAAPIEIPGPSANKFCVVPGLLWLTVLVPAGTAAEVSQDRFGRCGRDNARHKRGFRGELRRILGEVAEGIKR